MIKISYNNKEYNINKDKLIFVLSKLKNDNVIEEEIENLLIKFQLMDEDFLENINKI